MTDSTTTEDPETIDEPEIEEPHPGDATPGVERGKDGLLTLGAFERKFQRGLLYTSVLSWGLFIALTVPIPGLWTATLLTAVGATTLYSLYRFVP